jgi:monomeric sarcosine oxidase
MESYDVVIIGGGVMGTSAACEIARSGAKVAIIDQAALPNPRGASVDYSKVFRLAYPDPFYVKMAVDALKLWRDLEEATSTRMLSQTGALLVGSQGTSFETMCYDALRQLSLEAEMLSSREAADRFSEFNPDAFSYAVFDPSGAIIHAEAAVRSLVEMARRLGVRIIEGERASGIERGVTACVMTETGRKLYCRTAIAASGPWTRELMPELSSVLTTTKQEVFYFEPSGGGFDAASFPIFIALDTGFYGFPIHHEGAMKIANHQKGEAVEAYSIEDAIDDRSIEACRDFFRSYIPALAAARLKEARVCMYNNTPDDDFLIDWHPELDNVLLVTGFSGHGFKFGPLIGRIASELLIEGRTRYPIERFRLARFQ